MSKPIHVDTDSFESEVLQAAEPVLVDFWAPWCGPCRMIGPVLEELAEKYDGRVKVAKVNVDEEPELAQLFQIRGIPTLYAVVGGDVVDVMVGFGGKRHLQEAFAKLADMKPQESQEVSVA